MRKILLCLLAVSFALSAGAQSRYVNPILHWDYSDPDICRVGEDYYLTASSFNHFPGLPILHSRDLVHWTQVGAALESYRGFTTQMKVRHGEGVWAPAIRYHDGWFYIFFGNPDLGIFRVRTQDPAGRWEAPVMVYRGKGFIDPCPLWDEDGKAWLSMALAGSRAGLKSVVLVAEMDPSGEKLLESPRIVFDGHLTQPTIEGTKFYKRDGKYYLFCPAGGVATGWQAVLRAAHPYGPYEERIVMASAEGTVNGPHQGGWVDTPYGEDWFLHFQDKGAYGRIVHLQPMSWRGDGWPLIGEDPDGDGIGQPVKGGIVPRCDALGADPEPAYLPLGLPLGWQFPCVPSPTWYSLRPDGGIRLYSTLTQENLWDCHSLALQKFSAEKFTVTARLEFCPQDGKGETADFVVMGSDYAGLRIDGEGRLSYFFCLGADKQGTETIQEVASLPVEVTERNYPCASSNVPAVKYTPLRTVVFWVRLEVAPRPVEGNVPDAVCRFSYSLNGKRFTRLPEVFTAREGRWIGAKWGFCCSRPSASNDGGWLDISFVR